VYAAPEQKAAPQGKGRPTADPAQIQPRDVRAVDAAGHGRMAPVEAPKVPPQARGAEKQAEAHIKAAEQQAEGQAKAADAQVQAAEKKAEGQAKAADAQVKAAEKQAAKDPTGKPGKRVGWWRRWFGGGSSETEPTETAE